MPQDTGQYVEGRFMQLQAYSNYLIQRGIHEEKFFFTVMRFFLSSKHQNYVRKKKFLHLYQIINIFLKFIIHQDRLTSYAWCLVYRFNRIQFRLVLVIHVGLKTIGVLLVQKLVRMWYTNQAIVFLYIQKIKYYGFPADKINQDDYM